MQTTVEIRRMDDWPADVLQVIRGWMPEAFGDGGGYAWATMDWRVVAFQDGAPVSQVEIVVRDGLVNGQPVKLGGIGTVVTPPEHRRKGFASQAMQAADDFMRDTLGVEFGFLITGGEFRVRLYSQLGWQVVQGPMFFTQPERGRVTWPDDDLPVLMVLPFGGRVWPGGEIDVCGLPW